MDKANIFLLEFAEDVQCYTEHREQGDIVVALSPGVSLELDIMEIPHKCLRVDYYTHEEYMANVSEWKRQLKSNIQALDKELWKHSPVYKAAGIRSFEMFSYSFRFLLDTLRTEIFELDKLFNKESVNKVKLIKRKTQPKYDNILFYDNESVYETLIYLMQKKYKYDIEAIDNKYVVKSNSIRTRSSASRFLTWKDLHFVNEIKGIIKKLYKLKDRSLNIKGNILSVDCWELLCIRQKLNSLGWSIHQFPSSLLDSVLRLSDRYKYNGLVGEFEKNTDLIKCFELLGVNFFGIMKNRLEYFCRNLEANFIKFKILSNYIYNNNFDIIFFTTHSPFKIQNVMLPLICRERKIPYVCWMHGGYGANYSVPGYELSDYAFGQHYFVYGEEVKKMIDSYYPEYKLSTYVAGSPLLLERYKNYIAPKNAKKIVTLIVTPWFTNCFHAGMDSSYYRFSHWVPTKEILKLLIEYRDRYRIIIRAIEWHDGVRLQREAFRKFLKYYHAEEIEIISVHDQPFEEIARITDLFITFGISTTFLEACLTHADIFLMDDSDISKAAEKILPKRAFWYDDLTQFIQGLQQYLDKGIFYQKSHDKSFLKSYMDFDNRDYLPEHISQTIENIVYKKDKEI